MNNGKNLNKRKKCREKFSVIPTIYFLSLLTILLLQNGCSKNNNSYEYSGTIENRANIVSSQTPGVVNRLFFDKGDLVKKGDTLAIIDHSKLDLQLLQADASIKSLKYKLQMLETGARKEDKKVAEEKIKQAEANYLFAKKNKKRMTKLYATNSITKSQLDKTILAYKIAESQYISAKQMLKKIRTPRPEQIDELKALIEKSEAGRDIIKKNINDCYLTSPINGQIVNRFVEKKELVSFMTSLFKIVDLSRSELTIYVPETDLAMVKLGQKAKVYIDAFKNKFFDGVVYYISPTAEFTPKNIQTKDERTKLVFAVKIKIDNPEMILKSGMPADAKLMISE